MISAVQMDFVQIAFQPPPLKQPDPLGLLFLPTISQFFKTAVLTMEIDIFKIKTAVLKSWQIFAENSSHKASVCLRGGGWKAIWQNSIWTALFFRWGFPNTLPPTPHITPPPHHKSNFFEKLKQHWKTGHFEFDTSGTKIAVLLIEDGFPQNNV